MHIVEHIEHILFGVLLIGRLGDVVSTWLATPSLNLESNPIARRLRWPWIVASVGLCIAPYFSIELGIVLTVISLWVSADNISRLWLVRAIGEQQMAELVQRAAASSSLSRAVTMVIAKAVFIAIMGVLLCHFSWRFHPTWTFWFGVGILAYGGVNLWIGTWHLVRVFARTNDDALDR